MNCHKLVARDSEKLAPLRASAKSGMPLSWIRVHNLPDYAYFEHRAHVNAGVGCVSCHGRVDEMEVVKQVEPLSMGWCLECHRDPAPQFAAGERGHEHALGAGRGSRRVGGGMDRAARHPSARGLLRVPSVSHEYWRSLEGRAGAPRTRAFAESEFPEPVEEGLSLDRRTMLLLMGTSLSAAGIAACRRPEEKILPYVNAPENVVPGIPRHYATSMPLRHTAYGLVVESHEGRPTKIEGNPIHSGTAGRSTARIQAAIYDLYDPDRSRFVTTASSEANWETLVSAWKGRHEAHSANGGKGLAVLSPAFSAPTLFRLEQAFRERYPEARFVTWEPAGDENAQDGLRIATGQDREMKLHVDQASVILAIDSDFLRQ